MSNHTLIKNDKQLLKALEPVWREAIINRNAYIYIAQQTMVEKIEELVYLKYNPKMYKRRFDGMNGALGYGFAHKNSQLVEFDRKMQTMTITNKAKGQRYDNITKTYEQTDVLLQPIIESGEGYSWKKSSIYKSKLARPFSPSVMARLQETMPKVVTNKKLNQTDNRVVYGDYLPF